MPLEPPPTPWALSRPPDDHPRDAWALGADLEPGTMLSAYRLGIFPMRVDGDLVWWSPPQPRGHPGGRASPHPRSLRRAARGYEITVDTAFADVIRGCADPGSPARLDRRRVRRGLLGAAPARVGALDRGVGRRRARGRALRRRDRWALRGRIEVLSAFGSLEGGSPGAHPPASGSRGPEAPGRAVDDTASPLARRGRGRAGRVPPAAGRRSCPAGRLRNR